MSGIAEMNIHQKMNHVMKSCVYVQKEKKQGMKYAVVSHDDVTELVRPHLVDVGILYYPVKMSHVQSMNRTEVSLTLRFVNIDAPDQYIDVECLGYGVDDSDKGPGKAVSYAVKYGLLKAFGLRTGEDADLDQNTKLASVHPMRTLDIGPHDPVTGEVPTIKYADMNEAQRTVYWKQEWEKAPDESMFDSLVTAFRASEPEGSPVRLALSDVYKIQKLRVAKKA